MSVQTYEQILVATSLPLTTIPAGCHAALVQAETQNIRYRPDGADTDPTAAIGMVLLADDRPTKIQGNLAAFRFIEETATAKLNITYLSDSTAE